MNETVYHVSAQLLNEEQLWFPPSFDDTLYVECVRKTSRFLQQEGAHGGKDSKASALKGDDPRYTVSGETANCEVLYRTLKCLC